MNLRHINASVKLIIILLIRNNLIYATKKIQGYKCQNLNKNLN